MDVFILVLLTMFSGKLQRLLASAYSIDLSAMAHARPVWKKDVRDYVRRDIDD